MRKAVFLCIGLLSLLSALHAVEDVRKSVVSEAISLEGTRYQYGGTTPTGFDCSGFITYLFKKYVPSLPRISRDMARFGKKVNVSEILPGDLVFFATGRDGGTITHVALYIGKNAVIHSVSEGPQRGVIVTSLDTTYWKRRLSCAVRVLPGASLVERSDKPQKNPGKPGNSGTEEQKVIAETIIDVPNPAISPWNTFDGVIEGDFNLYLEKEKNAFNEWKNNN